LKQLFTAFLGLAAGLVATGANADYNLNYGALTCDGNRALVRFSNVWYGSPPVFPDPPPEIDHGLSELPRVDGNTCTLSDGREVKVKLGNRQGTAWGMCGAAANGYMSLWVGGRKVISWLQVTDECDSKDGPESTVILDGGKLSICDAEFSTCKDISPLLEQAAPDPVEYPPGGNVRPALGSMTLPVAEDVEFCNRFVPVSGGKHRPEFYALSQASIPDAFYDPGSMQTEPPPGYMDGPRPPFAVALFAFPVVGARPIEFEALTSETGSPIEPPYWSAARIDFDNDGEEDLVLRESWRSGGGWGDHFHLLSGREQRHSLVAAVNEFQSRGEKPNLKEIGDFVYNSGLLQYSGKFPAFSSQYTNGYILQNIFQAGDQVLVFATTVSRKARPTAIIYRPRPGGEADPVCVFQRVEENF